MHLGKIRRFPSRRESRNRSTSSASFLNGRRVKVRRRILFEHLILWKRVSRIPFFLLNEAIQLDTLFGLRRTQPIRFKLSFSSVIEIFRVSDGSVWVNPNTNDYDTRVYFGKHPLDKYLLEIALQSFFPIFHCQRKKGEKRNGHTSTKEIIKFCTFSLKFYLIEIKKYLR